MKILQIIPSLDTKYGGPVFVANLMRQLLDKHKVPNGILTLGLHEHSEIQNIISYKTSLKFWDYSTDFLLNAHKEIKKFDGILIHGIYSFLTIWTCILAIFYRKNVFLRPAGMLDFDSIFSGSKKKVSLRILYLIFVGPIIYAASCKIIFNSSKEIHNSLFGKSQKSLLLPNGVDPTIFENNAEIKVFKKKHKFFFMGRLDEIKGINLIIDAFSGLEKDISENVELIIAGDGDKNFVENLKSQASENVRFIGHIEGLEKYQYLKDCDIYLQPSKTEGLSNAMLEAMFCKVAMITTKHVGLSLELGEREAAEIIDFNVYELRTALIKLAKSESLVRKYQLNSYEFVKENYDFNHNIQKYIAVFHDTCSSS